MVVLSAVESEKDRVFHLPQRFIFTLNSITTYARIVGASCHVFPATSQGKEYPTKDLHQGKLEQSSFLSQVQNKNSI